MNGRDVIGTLSWAAKNQGALTPHETARLIGHGVLAVIEERSGRLATRLGGGRARAAAELRAPSTALAARAAALAREVSEPWLVEHCERTWAFASLLAARGDLRPDRELLYVASMFHDLGITERFLASEGECFAWRGARAAREFLLFEGMDEARATIVAEAICLHLEVRVGLERGIEAHLLRAATALDVVGQGAHRIPREQVDEVVRAHPRLGMKREIEAAIARQAARSPRSRIGILCRHLGMRARVRSAPFAD